jgi:hypothetical protein
MSGEMEKDSAVKRNAPNFVYPSWHPQSAVNSRNENGNGSGNSIHVQNQETKVEGKIEGMETGKRLNIWDRILGRLDEIEKRLVDVEKIGKL